MPTRPPWVYTRRIIAAGLTMDLDLPVLATVSGATAATAFVAVGSATGTAAAKVDQPGGCRPPLVTWPAVEEGCPATEQGRWAVQPLEARQAAARQALPARPGPWGGCSCRSQGCPRPGRPEARRWLYRRTQGRRGAANTRRAQRRMDRRHFSASQPTTD